MVKKPMRIARETLIIAAIGVADLVTTLIWVHNHSAQEANPLFARYLAMGPAWFALMKLVLLAAPLFLIEWARRHRPVFTRWASRVGIVAYIGMYVVGVWHVNSQDVRDYMSARAELAQADVERQHLLSEPALHKWAVGRHVPQDASIAAIATE